MHGIVLLQTSGILGAFAKLRKATFSFITALCPFVCPSLRMEQLGPHCTNFHEICCFSILRKISRENTSSLKMGQE